MGYKTHKIGPESPSGGWGVTVPLENLETGSQAAKNAKLGRCGSTSWTVSRHPGWREPKRGRSHEYCNRG